eukprot:CAMPEP_0169062114 /NCGR_PEP_ID=MMETSP1015-20121227/503_1 /TAXON_ID=342587 /ORGANISM="Karlodinium micrum, Strain CCMP2283" /LENGTH=203 /DNA_ID=CAMNT_0009120211 /DNA_START=124 /DNA_END=735 /DNA_ORIENTATION=-
MYKECAGTRSDFIIVGHPEFNLGKTRCQNLTGDWDQRRLTKKGRTVKGPSPSLCESGIFLQPLKERALQRSRSLADRDRASTRTPGLSGFLTALDADVREGKTEERAYVPPRYLASVETSDHNANSAVVRHYKRLRSELADIKQQWKVDPKKTREDLESTGAWRYYAPLLEKPAGPSPRKHRSQDKWLAHSNTLPGIRSTMWD